VSFRSRGEVRRRERVAGAGRIGVDRMDRHILCSVPRDDGRMPAAAR